MMASESLPGVGPGRPRDNRTPRFIVTDADTSKRAWASSPIKATKVSRRDGAGVSKRDTSLPPTKPNGQLVSSWRPEHDGNYTVYHYEGKRLRADNSKSSRRQQSLPPRKPEGDDVVRPTLSAPHNDAPLGPLPKINNLVTKDYAGVSTQSRDAGFNRSKNNKFASSWAKARVENATVVNDSDDRKKKHQHHQEANKQKKEDKAHGLTDDSRRSDETTVKLHHGKEQRHEHSPKQNEKTADTFHASGSNKEHASFAEAPPAQRNIKVTQNKPSPVEPPPTSPADSSDSEIQNKAKIRTYQWRANFRQGDPPVFVSERERRRQERELTYKPTLTDIKDIYKAYIGVTKGNMKNDNERNRTSHSDSEVHERKSRVPSDKERVLNSRETHSWIKIHSVYGSESYKKQRKQCFIDKLAKAEMDMIKQKQIEEKENERRKNDSKIRQQRQLMFVRKRFQEQQWRRFRTQYVTSRVLEHELINRHKYGLPEPYGEDNETSAKPRRKKKPNISNFDEKKARQKYEKKFKNMFDYNAGPSWDSGGKTPKMEGIDIVVVEVHDAEGNVKHQKKDVKKIVKDAKLALSLSQTDDDAADKSKSRLTPGYRHGRSRSRSRGHSGDRSQYKSRSQSWGRESLDSLDLDDDDDDDDIFEKARRKYNLNVDDDDDNSFRRLN